MAKKVQGIIRLQLPAGAANPAPPVGPALGAQGVNIMAFCKDFNAKTKDQNGLILPVVITVYSDKSFTYILKSPPASVLLKKACNIASGSGQQAAGRDANGEQRYAHAQAHREQRRAAEYRIAGLADVEQGSGERRGDTRSDDDRRQCAHGSDAVAMRSTAKS